MEAKIRGEAVATEVNGMGKMNLEWDLNDWKWDGDLFRASPLNPTPLDCRSKQLFPLGPELAANTNVSNSSYLRVEDISRNNENGKREMERRRVLVSPDEFNDEGGPLNLKLGEQVYPIAENGVDKLEGRSVKKSKSAGTSQPSCQVEGCRADLSKARDYHRRHKVCEVHSKASEAFVGNVMQRFCQQCSRFHALQEFDEGKRSCRRRLDGHNKRRRKTHSETLPVSSPLTDERSAGPAGYLLVSLLRALSNLNPNASGDSKDQDLISHLLRNLAGQVTGSDMLDLQRGSQGLPNAGISVGTPGKTPPRSQEPSQAVPSAVTQVELLMRENQNGTKQTISASQGVVSPANGSIPEKGIVQESYLERHRLTGIDLNHVCNDSEECMNSSENGHGIVTLAFRTEQQKSSPPQRSGNSDTTSGHSSSSGSETQGRTDRIVFKLFGKDPNDLPHLLRTQILDWLSHSPTDIEGYIRPGCVVLTIYLRLNKALWDELCYDMNSSLSRLLNGSDDPFWKTGWIYTRVQQRAAFICDGRIVLNTPLPFKDRQSRISSISPIAVPASETVQLVIRGSNLSGPSSRLLCAIEGKYLVQESCNALVERNDTVADLDEVHSLSFCCSVPDVVGRGFVEVEDYGLSGCFFPFLVAEPEICSEICMLEKVMEVSADEGSDVELDTIDARNDALDFIHEMGWLLHRSCSNSKQGDMAIHLDPFPFDRLKWLIEFSMVHDWSAVLGKLLDLLFSGTVDTGDHASVEYALSEMTLLHTAVQRNSRSMVEFLLSYIPKKVINTFDLEHMKPDYEPSSSFLFRPDVTGSNELTPLHIAASCAGFENVLDALLEDPEKVGIRAWENARDSTGLTPKDYACLRGHNQYIDLFKKKTNKDSSDKHVLVDIVGLSKLESKQKQSDKFNPAKLSSLQTETLQVSQSCKLCEQKPVYGYRGATLACRPAMMSLVAIAVVCVCTALLFKSMPRVCYIFGPFRWDSLKFGAM